MPQSSVAWQQQALCCCGRVLTLCIPGVNGSRPQVRQQLLAGMVVQVDLLHLTHEASRRGGACARSCTCPAEAHRPRATAKPPGSSSSQHHVVIARRYGFEALSINEFSGLEISCDAGDSGCVNGYRPGEDTLEVSHGGRGDGGGGDGEDGADARP